MIGMNEHPEEWAHRPEERTVSDLVECLREHAYRVGPNDSNYDPEPLDLETAAADRIEELQDRVVELEAEVELNQRHIVALQEETVRREIRLKEAEAEVGRLLTALWNIVNDGDACVEANEGICPYGCRAPETARAALEGDDG